MRALVAWFAGSVAAAAIISALIGHGKLLNIFYSSVYGLVLVGRVATMYMVVYSLTGNELAAIFAGILYNNVLAVTALYMLPLVLHLLHTRKPRRFRIPTWMMVGWGFNQAVMKVMAVFFISLLGFTMYLAAVAVGFSLFMVFEASYAILVATIVYNASRLNAETLHPEYRRMLKKAGPLTAFLLILSAILEAYEIVVR